MSMDHTQIQTSTDMEANAIDVESAQIPSYERRWFKIALVLTFYVGTYSILSANGRYYGRPSGERRWKSGLSLTDLSVWFPAGVTWERRKSISGDYVIDADPLGWFYLPLLLVDRKWVHPTGHYFDSEDE